METKVCRICKQEKPIERFSFRNDNQKYRTECKDCLNVLRKQQPAFGRWHKLNKERVKKYMADLSLKRYWGMTREEFDSRLEAQGGKCKICGTCKWMGKGNRPHVDHCHKTGKIRGLLCNLCNVGLGAFKDSTDSLEKAIQYLKESK